MESVIDRVRNMVSAGCTLAELLHFLRSREDFKLTPLNFMRVLSEAAGLSMLESRDIISMFGPDFEPIVPSDELELQWRRKIEGKAGGPS